MIKNMLLMFITIIAAITLFAAVAFADCMETHTMLTLVLVSVGWIGLFCRANGI